MAKKLNVPVIVFASIILVGFILVFVGMCTPIVSQAQLKVSIGLFDEEWAELEKASEMASALGLTLPDRTFTLIAFVLLILSTIMALVNAILGIFQKGIKGLGIAGGVIAIVSGVLVLSAGMLLAGQFNTYMRLVNTTVAPGAGIWLGGFAGILIGVMGIIAAAKGAKKKAAPAAA